jgi:hypothetical protein
MVNQHLRLRHRESIAHMYTVVRSMTHGDNGHESAYYSLMTGRPHPSPNTANARPTPGDYPNYGSALSFLRPSADSVPAFVVAGGLISTHIGQTGGFLGSTWSPYVIRQDADLPDFSVPDFALPESMSPEKLNQRRGLLARLGYSEIASNPSSASEGFLRNQQRAIDLMTGSRLHSAFDIDAESPATRAAYGDNWFGQNVLLARRLSEAGVPVVQVNYRIEIIKAGRVQWITVL